MQTTQTFPFEVYSVAWSPDGRHIAAAGSRKMMRIWEVGQKRKGLICRGHQDSIWQVAYSPDGSHLASISDDHSVRVWNPLTGKTLTRFPCAPIPEKHGTPPTVRALAWSSDGRRLATGADEPMVRIWDAETGKLLLTYHTAGVAVRSTAWSPDGSKMATGSTSNPIEIWNTTGGTKYLELEGAHSATNIAWSLDGTKIAATVYHPKTFSPCLFLWDATTGELQHDDFRSHFPVAWSPNRKLLAYPDTNIIAIQNAEDGRMVQRLTGDTHNLISLCWSPDGRYLASGSSDKTVRIWSLDPET